MSLQLRADDLQRIGGFLSVPGDHLVDPCKRRQPAFERREIVIYALAVPFRLAGNSGHIGKNVVHPVVQLDVDSRRDWLIDERQGAGIAVGDRTCLG
jgi:hypothetical protein